MVVIFLSTGMSKEQWILACSNCLYQSNIDWITFNFAKHVSLLPENELLSSDQGATAMVRVAAKILGSIYVQHLLEFNELESRKCGCALMSATAAGNCIYIYIYIFIHNYIQFRNVTCFKYWMTVLQYVDILFPQSQSYQHIQLLTLYGFRGPTIRQSMHHLMGWSTGISHGTNVQ